MMIVTFDFEFSPVQSKKIVPNNLSILNGEPKKSPLNRYSSRIQNHTLNRSATSTEYGYWDIRWATYECVHFFDWKSPVSRSISV